MNLYYFKDEDNINTFTTAKSDTVVNGITYTPRAIKRSRYVLDSLVKKNNISITFAGDDDFALQYIHPTTLTLTVNISLLTGVIFYRGRLVTVRYQANKITMIFEQLVRLGSQYSGDRRLYQQNCPYELYGANCRAKEYRHSFTILTMPSPTTIRLRYTTPDISVLTGDTALAVLRTEYDPNIKVGISALSGGLLYLRQPVEVTQFDIIPGKIYWITKIDDLQVSKMVVDPSNPHELKVVDFTVTTFRRYDRDDYNIGDTVYASFGCARTTSDCSTLHNNIKNYGGFAGLKISPFTGLRGG